MTQYSGAKINIIFELPKFFSKKYRFWPKILDSVGKKRGNTGAGAGETKTEKTLFESFSTLCFRPAIGGELLESLLSPSHRRQQNKSIPDIKLSKRKTTLR